MRHLDLLNAFLALRFRQPGYPACLEELGYLVHSIGVTIKLPDGAKVTPDVITSQPDRSLTLLVEVKGGKQIDGDQLSRLTSITSTILRDHAHVSIRDAGQHQVQVVYVCNETDRADLAAQVSSRSVAVLGFDGSRFRASGAAVGDADLSACLAKGEVSPGAPPLAIIPFDRESPDGEVARAILPRVVDAWMKGAGTVRPDLLVGQTHHLVHADMSSTGSGSELADIVDRVKKVLDALAKAELADLLERVPSQPAWKFRRGLPNDNNRTRELQKVQKAAERYLESVEGAGTRRAVQLKLFESEEPPKS